MVDGDIDIEIGHDDTSDTIDKKINDALWAKKAKEHNMTKDIKMNKDQAREAAMEWQGKLLDKCSRVGDTGGMYYVALTISGAHLAYFPYTPEPEPIKKGVLCVGEDSEGDERVGWSTGLSSSELALVNEYYDMDLGTPFRLCNARPVTPADLRRWGYEGDEDKTKPATLHSEGVCPVCRDGMLVKVLGDVDRYECTNKDCGAGFVQMKGVVE
jgi:hypothetical protein